MVVPIDRELRYDFNGTIASAVCVSFFCNWSHSLVIVTVSFGFVFVSSSLSGFKMGVEGSHLGGRCWWSRVRFI